MTERIIQEINAVEKGLDHHPIYKEINDLKSLRLFMEHHVYAVFDFMSLLKNLQRSLAPVTSVWIPPQDKELARFINEIVLGEESDLLPSRKPISHFEMYCEAMREVNACSEKALEFSKVFNLEKRSEAL